MEQSFKRWAVSCDKRNRQNALCSQEMRIHGKDSIKISFCQLIKINFVLMCSNKSCQRGAYLLSRCLVMVIAVKNIPQAYALQLKK
jgi:hypothetical protein